MLELSAAEVQWLPTLSRAWIGRVHDDCYLKYFGSLTAAQAAHLDDQISWRAQLSESARSVLDAHCAWPREFVELLGERVGFVMGAMPTELEPIGLRPRTPNHAFAEALVAAARSIRNLGLCGPGADHRYDWHVGDKRRVFFTSCDEWTADDGAPSPFAWPSPSGGVAKAVGSHVEESLGKALALLLGGAPSAVGSQLADERHAELASLVADVVDPTRPAPSLERWERCFVGRVLGSALAARYDALCALPADELRTPLDRALAEVALRHVLAENAPIGVAAIARGDTLHVRWDWPVSADTRAAELRVFSSQPFREWSDARAFVVRSDAPGGTASTTAPTMDDDWPLYVQLSPAGVLDDGVERRWLVGSVGASRVWVSKVGVE